MAEGNKRREWVKNAVIIFLAAMLILTFFSNTIMNWSLPEVSAQYTSGGQLSEQIRGTAVVEAAESYTVKIGETRTIASVEVRTGDTVEKGQTLVKLEAGDSKELETALDDVEKAENELENAETEYKKMLLKSGNDYSLEELAIANLEADIASDKKDLKNISVYQKEYEDAKKVLKKAEEKVNDLTAKKKEYEDQLLLANSDKETDIASLDSGYYSKLKDALDKVSKGEKNKNTADAEVEKLKKELGAEIDNIDIQKKRAEIDNTQKTIDDLKLKVMSAYANNKYDEAIALEEQQSAAEFKLENLELELKDLISKSSKDFTTKNQLSYAETRQKDAETTYDNYKKNLTDVRTSVIMDITDKKNKNEALLTKANDELDAAKEAEAEAKAKASMTLEEAESKIKEKERDLERQKATLAKSQKNDLESAGVSAIDIEVKQKSIEKIKENIEKLKERAEKLKEESEGGEVTAQVAGVIDSISCIAGETVQGGTDIVVIQMTEKGYTASINVTAEQAKKVKPGDKAEIQYFWYGNAEAVLTAIKSDKSNPQNKQLVFGVTGDITPGQSLQLVMGGKGQQYEHLVPNSAIREDNNGKFILAVTAKSSPLGNRYIARRIDIQVLASSDTTSAVSGEIMSGEFIISTSTKPINPGDQVRLVDN